MVVALDVNKNRVHIDNTITRESYFCPCCGGELIRKMGEERQHHFAHRQNTECSDSWAGSYDMSEWHQQWQSCYPVCNQEIQLNLGKVRHRADVLTGKTIVEFQHSHITMTNFSNRNYFYTSLGYKVVWLFDLREEYSSGKLKRADGSSTDFVWSRPLSALKNFELRTSQADIFFQLSDDDDSIIRVANESPSFEHFTAAKWYNKEQFLVYTGCEPPCLQSIETDRDYISFCEKYNIHLDPDQERAVETINGAILLIAVPGSGKTTVLSARLGYMILCRGISPKNILTLSYTKNSAKDITDRLCKMFGSEFADTVKVKTVNSLAAEINTRFWKTNPDIRSLKIADEKTTFPIIKKILKERGTEYPNDSEIRDVISTISKNKNLMKDESQISEYENSVLKEYQNELKNKWLMDFDDQIRYALKLLTEHPGLLAECQQRYQYMCVDEAQDLSKLQHTFIRTLCGHTDKNNIFMVGDEDQSIYGFRGAFPDSLLSFSHDYLNPHTLFLSRNYRSSKEIVVLSAKFISKTAGRYDKDITAVRGNAGKVKFINVQNRAEQFSKIIEAAKNPGEPIAVIYRSNDSSVPLIDLLLREGIPFSAYSSRNEQRFFSSRAVEDVKAFLTYTLNEHDKNAFMQIYHKCGCWLDKRSAEYAYKRSYRERISITEALIKNGERFLPLKPKAEEFKELITDAQNSDTAQAIEAFMYSGYLRYLQEKGGDTNKLDILLMLAENEPDKSRFLERLEQLKGSADYRAEDSRVILTTAHSSKGLEFDTVYIVDVADGLFPSVEYNDAILDSETYSEYLEERRMFYVAMTRAKNSLNVFSIKGMNSLFCKELQSTK